MLEYINRPYLFRSNVCYYFFLIFHIQTYEVHDYKLYNTDSQINNNWSKTAINNGYTYQSNYVMNVGETVSFKCSTLPNRAMWGIGSSQGNFVIIQKYDNSGAIYLDGGTDSFSHRIAVNSVIKLKVTSDTTCEFYIDDTLVKTLTSTDTYPKQLMVHEYNSYQFTMEYVKVL